jgi:hypothetical protein
VLPACLAGSWSVCADFCTIQSETQRATIQRRNRAGKSSRRNPSSTSLGSLLSWVAHRVPQLGMLDRESFPSFACAERHLNSAQKKGRGKSN